MDEFEVYPSENDSAMDVDITDNNQDSSQAGPSATTLENTRDDVHPLVLVRVNVDPSYDVNNDDDDDDDDDDNSSDNQEGEVILGFDVNSERISPSFSTTSSRNPSPTICDNEENSNQCESATATLSTSPPTKKRTLNDSEYINEDDGALCPICLDNWTTTGEHRICSLKCGHLFGYKCVNRWLNSQTKRTCPTCKKRVSRGDIRYIYAKRLIAVDTAEIELIKRQLDFVTHERNKAQNELAKSVCREQLLKREIEQLKNQYSKASWNGSTNKILHDVRLFMDKSIPICKYGESRVFDASCRLDLLVASMKSPTSLFTGYGLRKINISSYKPLAFLPVHQAQIRDIAFHPETNLILTASMDKHFKIVDNNTNTITHQFNHAMPLWSCCWDQYKDTIVYVGTQSGSVLKYDLRQLTGPVANLSIEGDMSPVVSIATIPNSPSQPCEGGVISCKLNSLWLFEQNGADYKRHSLSLEGPFVSMKYQLQTKQLLVSSRPNSRISYSRHTLCTLTRNNNDDNGFNCNVIHSFQGGGMQKLLSKSCFVEDTREYVAAHQENSKSVVLWSINTGDKVCSIPAHDAVLDLKGIQNHCGNYIVSLSERKLEFFKFI